MTVAAAPMTGGSRFGACAKPAEWQLALPLTLAFASLFLAPLLMLCGVSFFNDDKITEPGFGQWIKFLGDPFNYKVIADTLLLGVKTVCATVLFGYPLALVYIDAPPRLQRVLIFIIVMPLLLSVVVRTFAWIVMLGREGVVNQVLISLGIVSEPLRLLQTELGLVISLTQIEMPLMLLPLISVMSRLDPNLRDASAALGASRWRTLFTVTVPLSMPGLVAGCLLVFASSTTAFISQTVIGGVRLIYLPLLIWQQSLVVFNWPLAAVASLTLLVSVLSVVGALAYVGRRSSGLRPWLGAAARRHLLRRRDRHARHRGAGHHRGAGRGRADDLVHREPLAEVPADRLLAAVVRGAVRSLEVAPDPSRRVELAGGRGLVDRVRRAAGHHGGLGLSRSRHKLARVADSFFMSPLVLPGLTFGLAALMYFTLMGFRPSLDLIIAGHMIVTVPFILRTTTASLSQLDPALIDSSQSLGASWFYTLRRVTLPLIAPGIFAGAFLAFMASIDNVPVSLFLSTAQTDMLPIRMWGMMESTLDPRVAAVSGVLIASAFLLMLIMEWTVGLTRRMRD